MSSVESDRMGYGAASIELARGIGAFAKKNPGKTAGIAVFSGLVLLGMISQCNEALNSFDENSGKKDTADLEPSQPEARNLEMSLESGQVITLG